MIKYLHPSFQGCEFPPLVQAKAKPLWRNRKFNIAEVEVTMETSQSGNHCVQTDSGETSWHLQNKNFFICYNCYLQQYPHTEEHIHAITTV